MAVLFDTVNKDSTAYKNLTAVDLATLNTKLGVPKTEMAIATFESPFAGNAKYWYIGGVLLLVVLIVFALKK